MQQANGKFASGNSTKAWLPFLCIIAASAVAHLWCLGSQFYMDDMIQIRDSDVVRSWHFTEMGPLSWTYLWYGLLFRLFGMSPVAFHGLNWILHTAVACSLFAFGRDFLRDHWHWGVSWFAGLLFAVHPLASEIPNYARSQDLAWVTLFSLLVAWNLLLFLRQRRWWNLAACALFLLGATFSKGPGFFHALMATAAVGLASVSSMHWQLLRRHFVKIAGALGVVLVSLWLSGSLSSWINLSAGWSGPRFIGHAYTISRVFWEFAWRSVIPVQLSSDHHIAETLVPAGSSFWNIPDHGAMVAAFAFLMLAGFSVFLACRKPTRCFGVCLLVYVATILFRVFYVVPEFMPEYRIYPGLPWFCLGAGILLSSVWNWMFPTASPRVPAGVLLGIFIALSARRSFLWHDLDRLLADVLRQYPGQARVVWELDDRDVARGNWQAIIDRQRDAWPEVARQFHLANQRLAPARELPTGHFALAEVACAGRYARALAKLEGPPAGLREMNRLEFYMHQLRLDPLAHKIHWDYFKHDKGLILEQAGDYAAAISYLSPAAGRSDWKHDLERVENELAALKKGS